MKKHLLTVFAAALVAAFAPARAGAQTLNMDLSWGTRQQMALQAQGDAYARWVAQTYYNYMLQLRMAGYTGPSLPTGVTAQSLQASMQRLQQSMDAYHAASARNSDRRSSAVAAWDYAALRGCRVYFDPRGFRYIACPAY